MKLNVHLQERSRTADTEARLPCAGDYVTDGVALFYVESDRVRTSDGERLLELEDCRTLDLIVCTARAMARAGIRFVPPRRQQRGDAGATSSVL